MSNKTNMPSVCACADHVTPSLARAVTAHVSACYACAVHPQRPTALHTGHFLHVFSSKMNKYLKLKTVFDLCFCACSDEPETN